jgi:ubiquinone/menaquinone biosynthesis C-methylase UbiE
MKEEMERLNTQAEEFSDFVSEALRKLNVCSGMTVADIGCGTGYVSMMMSNLVGLNGKVVGLDANFNALEYCKRLADKNKKKNLEFVIGDAQQMEFLPAIFDAVYSRFLLQHLKEPKKCLHEMIRITKPNGLVMTEDCDLRLWMVEPQDKYIEELWTWYEFIVRQKGSDPTIGIKLYNMFVNEGLQPKVEVYSKPLFANDKMWNSITLVLEKANAGLDNEAIVGIKNFMQRRDAIFIFPLVFRVWAQVRC